MPTLTPNYSFNQPLVNDPVDEDLWGGQLNSNWGSIDSLLLTATNDLNNPLTFADSPYTLLDTDQNKVLSVDASGGNVVINLLSGATAGDGYKVSIKKTDSTENTVTINGNIDGGSSSVLVRENNVITVAADGTDWNSLTSNASTLLIPSVSVDFADSPYTVDASDQNKILLVDTSGGNVDIDLQASAAAGNGFELIVKKIDATANTVSVNGDAAETIDGSNTQTLTRQYETITPIADAANWNLSTTIDWLSTNDVGTGPNQLVQFNGSAQYPGNDGSLITDLTTDSQSIQRNVLSAATSSSFLNLSSDFSIYQFRIRISSIVTVSAINMDFSTNNGVSWITNSFRINLNSASISAEASIVPTSSFGPTYSDILLFNPADNSPTGALVESVTLGVAGSSPAKMTGGFGLAASQIVNAVRFRKTAGTMTGEILMSGQRTI